MISIRPEVAIYAAFARLNYRPWYALAEFVDNSVQSALTNLDALRQAQVNHYLLVVEIDADNERIEIRDNAAGIHARDYARAFLPASPPPDPSGLSEFGLGMKAAASWFARKWAVRTTALGEAIERTITFDVPTIVETSCEHLEPEERPTGASEHYTTVILRDLRVTPRGRTIGKIKDHLSSIYRMFIRDNLLELRLNGEILSHEPPAFLCAPYHKNPSSKPLTWYKQIDLDLDGAHRVTGWAAILSRASVTNAGFSIFRRRRLIQGSHGEGYRPEVIFGKPNKFVFQRLVGELQLEGFSVSHTKDGIQWEDWEDDVLEWIKDLLDQEPLPLLDQALHYRARTQAIRDTVGEATIDTSNVIAHHLPPIIDDQISTQPNEDPLVDELDPAEEVSRRSRQIQFDLDQAQRHWSLTLELVADPSRDDWYEISETTKAGDTTEVHIRVNIAHPFMVRFTSPDGDEIIPFTRITAGLAIAEITAREVGVREAGTLRNNLNQILRSGLSGPIQQGET